jgi:hypothetical protein
VKGEEMKTCEKCKFWGTDYPREDECEIITEMSEELLSDPDWYYSVLTKPDFGCIKWEKKSD